MKLLVLFSLCYLAFANNEDLKGDKVFRITPKTKDELVKIHQWIQTAGDMLDVWKEPSQIGGHIDIHVKKEDVDDIKKHLSSFDYKIVIDDLFQVIDEEAKSNEDYAFTGSFNYERYNRVYQIHNELRTLAQQHGNAETFTVGRSYNNQEMLGIKVSHRTSTGPKQAIWVDGGIHAREWISPATVMWLLRELLEPTEPSLAMKADAALRKYDFYILPVFNVDGYEYTHYGRRLWRKTRSPTRYYWCKGADPNRNWDSMFKFPPIPNSGTSENPCSDIYRGSKAFSEVEVLNVARELSRISKSVGLKSYWNVHAYSQLLLYPWSYKNTPSKDNAEIARVAKVFTDSVSRRYGKRYVAGQPGNILYNVAGGSIDWTYEKLGVKYSFAPELRPSGNEHHIGFALPARLIRPSALEFCDGFFDSVLAMK